MLCIHLFQFQPLACLPFEPNRNELDEATSCDPASRVLSDAGLVHLEPAKVECYCYLRLTMKTLLSTEELERLPKPDRGGGYELDEGEAVYVSPNSLEQSKIIYRLCALLEEWAKSGDWGLVAPDTWFELFPGVVRAPDVAFVPRDRASNLDPKHPLKVVPALIVEVLSPRNTAREMSRKIQQYRDAGVELIWIVDPEKGEIDIHSSLPLRTAKRGGNLSHDKILPGLSIPVSMIFEPIR